MPRPKPPGPDVVRPKGNKYCLPTLFSSLQSLDQILNFIAHFKSIFKKKILYMNNVSAKAC